MISDTLWDCSTVRLRNNTVITEKTEKAGGPRTRFELGWRGNIVEEFQSGNP